MQREAGIDLRLFLFALVTQNPYMWGLMAQLNVLFTLFLGLLAIHITQTVRSKGLAYFLVALVVLEPIWKYRVFYLLIGGFFITIYIKSTVTAGYGPVNPILFVLTACLSIALIFSAYRFRKGEM